MEFIRGDTWLFKFQVKSKGVIVTSKEDINELFVTIKKNQYTQKVIVQKNIDDVIISEDGYVHVNLTPEETAKIQPGDYYGDIEVTSKDGIRKTKIFRLQVIHDITVHGGDTNE